MHAAFQYSFIALDLLEKLLSQVTVGDVHARLLSADRAIKTFCPIWITWSRAGESRGQLEMDEA